MKSIWAGGLDNAFFSNDMFDKHRILMTAEDKTIFPRNRRHVIDNFYVLGVDLGRSGCQSEIVVIKVTPGKDNTLLKDIVNIYSMSDEDFEVQAMKVKRVFNKFSAHMIVPDANGLGSGFIDFMTKPQTDPETGEVYPPFGVKNTDQYPLYKSYNNLPNIQRDKMFLVKANAPLNTEGYSYLQTQMSNGKIRFLIDEKQAAVRLDSTRVGRHMKPEQRILHLRPYVQTSILQQQLMNLVKDTSDTSINIILKRNNKKIEKDKVSALMYGMLYIKQYEEKRRGRRNGDVSKFMFFN